MAEAATATRDAAVPAHLCRHPRLFVVQRTENVSDAGCTAQTGQLKLLTPTNTTFVF